MGVRVEVIAARRRWQAVLERPLSLAITLDFDGAQPSFFGAPPATARALTAGSFTGDVRTGASCRCSTLTLTPHCNGTHTECVGHVTLEPAGVHALAQELMPARLITVTPQTQPDTADDFVITAGQLREAVRETDPADCPALIVRTLPNPADKRRRRYESSASTPYFHPEAMRWIVAQGIEHLVTDLPSVDRMDDGKLAAHRIFWGLPAGGTALAEARRPAATITELAYVDAAIDDGLYLLSLQVAPFATDAAPSRPVLYPLEPVTS